MITLELAAPGSGKPMPVRVEASEGISECFAVDVDVLCDGAGLQAGAVLQAAATVTVGDAFASHSFAGVVTGLVAHGPVPGGQSWFRLRIEPKLRLLGLTRRSRVFCTEQPATVPDVLSHVLASGIGVSPIASRTNLMTSYPSRDMVVQYDETDLDFLSRLAEDSGIFWTVGQYGGEETVLFGDSNLSCPKLDAGLGGSVLPYRPSVGMADTALAVRRATLESAVATGGATLDEWSFMAPYMSLAVTSPPLDGGIGLRQSWGVDNYVDAEWGRSLAAIRAQEAAAGREVLTVETNVPQLAAGQLFSLDGHPAPGVDNDYIATRVQHRAWQSVAGAEYIPGGIPPGTGYGNTVRAIPAANQYRPPRSTAKPRIHGLVRAVIDATSPVQANGPGSRALRSDVDPMGFYRIVFPFDVTPHPPGKASCAVRLLSVYGGPQEGMHFPLRPGTQVMVAFHNGDPDRPVIVGAVPDAVQASMVTQANRTVHTIRTASGILMRFDDGLPRS